MIKSELLKDEGILIVTPEAPLESDDFLTLANKIDPHIEENGQLHGLMIHAKLFPGWKDFAGLVSHFKFVKEHHTKIEKVAVVSDSGVLSIMPAIVDHFVNAEVKHFDHKDGETALEWLTEAR